MTPGANPECTISESGIATHLILQLNVSAL
jgi:hypothetical protein